MSDPTAVFVSFRARDAYGVVLHRTERAAALRADTLPDGDYCTYAEYVAWHPRPSIWVSDPAGVLRG